MDGCVNHIAHPNRRFNSRKPEFEENITCHDRHISILPVEDACQCGEGLFATLHEFSFVLHTIICFCIRYLCVDELCLSDLDFHTDLLNWIDAFNSESLSGNLDAFVDPLSSRYIIVLSICQLVVSRVNSLLLTYDVLFRYPAQPYAYSRDFGTTDSCPRGKNARAKFWKGGIGCNVHYSFFKIAVWFFGLFLIRVGEATNPGPVSDSTHPKEEFNIFHCNPTALIGKEHEIASWGQGVTLVSETSATARAQKIIQANLRKQSFKTFWSKPVTPYQQSKGEMRGLAGGTAIISSFPARCTLEPLPDDINESDRYTEAIIQFAPGQYMFCVALYGPVLGQRYHDSLGITNRLFSIAAQRATRFQGPSVIVGDLNCSTQQLSLWPSLVKQGWIDAGLKSAELNHHDIENTYDNITRHSFIFTSGSLRNALIDCRTTKHFVFSKHPVIKLRLKLQNIIQPTYIWKLPKSFDQFKHDANLAEHHASQLIGKLQGNFQKCLDNNQVDTTAKYWTMIAEETLRNSAVDKQGDVVKPKLGHMGRATKNPIQIKSPAIPIIKKPRDDHYIPRIDQGSVELRRHVKQLHRLQSLTSQVRALEKNFTEVAANQAHSLWLAICKAKGFHVSFVHWIYAHEIPCVPIQTPSVEYLNDLTQKFHSNLRALENDFRLYKTKIKQLEIIEDLKHGAALAFREVQKEALPPLNEIKFDIQTIVKRVKWPKEGLSKIWLVGENCFRVGQKVSFQMQDAIVTDIGDEHIHIDRPLKLRSSDFRITHCTSTADPQEMHAKVKGAWSKYFVRDGVGDDENNWVQTERFLNLVDCCPTMPYKMVTPEMLSNAIQTTKTKSARGSDGFTTMDLRKLPLCVWSCMCQIFHHIETKGGNWPGIWTFAKTLCLPKSEMPKSPMDVRPITILSKIYRLWAKIRGKQIAQHLAGMVPATVGGPCKGISSELIAQFTSIEIENALHSNLKIQGMVLDLVKCYNAIPRAPLYGILERLGVNPAYIGAFANMLQNMQRAFEINGSIDPNPWKTTTGIVEGCGVAVACMLALGIWCFYVIRECEPEAQSIMFADNWAVITHHLQQLQNIVDQIVGFLDALKMEMSPQKSWLWATCCSDRKSLKAIRAKNQEIPVVLHSKDLGVDQVYSKKSACPTKIAKVRKTIHKMKSIQKAKLPVGARKRIAVGAGLAMRTYGISTQLAAKSEYKNLRSATGAALLRTAGNASPWLALNTHDTNLDPQWRDITQAIQAWKRFIKFFPEQKSKLTQILAEGNPKVGAIGKLKAWCLRLGWQFDNNQQGTMSSGDKSFSWVKSPISTFKKVVGRDWNKYVAENCQHRNYFDLPDIDVITMKKHYDKASYLEQRLLEHHFTGRAYTNDEISRYDPQNEGKCPACGCQDSRQHRLFQCKETKALRIQNPKMIAKIAKSENARWYHGILPMPKGFDHHIEFLLNIPEIRPARPLIDLTPVHLFLDGSAFFNSTGYWTFAGAAVVLAFPSSYVVKCLERSLVPDVQQSSFHGELAAVAIALNKAWVCELYSDCQAVVNLIQSLIDAKNLGQQLPHVEHSIWLTIKQQIEDRPQYSVRIHKVKAHQNWKKLPKGLERWKAHANDHADTHAKLAVTEDNASHYQWLQKKVQIHQVEAEVHGQYLQYVCEVGKLFTKIQNNRPTKCGNGTNFDIHHHLLYRETAGVERRIQLSRPLFLAFPWGSVFLYRITAWASKLKWCKGICKCKNDISLLELFFDYIAYTNTLSPICLTPKSKRKDTKDGKRHSCWEMADMSLEADMKGQLPLAEHSKVFGRAMEFLIRNGNPLQWPTDIIPKTKSLCFIGLTTASRGFNCRPTLVEHDKGIQNLRNYLCTAKGIRRDLKSPLPIEGVPLEVPAEYIVPYKERIPFLYQTYQSYI